MRRLSAALVLGFASLGSAPRVAQADERADCAHAYEQAQRFQQSGENKKALDAAERCAMPTCPPLLAEECKPWIELIHKQLATVEVHVTGFDGCDKRTSTIQIDRVKHLPWTELDIEPGIHEVRAVDTATTRLVDKTVEFKRGEHRVIELRFAEANVVCGVPVDAGPAAPPPASGVPSVALGLGIAGGAMLVGGLVLGIIGASKRGDLDSCKPSCTSDQIDGARTFFVAGDVIGGVGLLTLGAAAAVYFLGRDGSGMRATSLLPSGRGVQVRF